MGRYLAIYNGAATEEQIFSTHPHLSLMDGNSIEVLECPPIPS